MNVEDCSDVRVSVSMVSGGRGVRKVHDISDSDSDGEATENFD